MTDQATSLGDELDGLEGRGIYHVAMIEIEYARYGLTYDRATDLLSFGDRSVALGARRLGDLVNQKPDDESLTLDAGPSALLLTDAVALSTAIHRLLFPNRRVPGARFESRDDQFEANLAAIRALDVAGPTEWIQ